MTRTFLLILCSGRPCSLCCGDDRASCTMDSDSKTRTSFETSCFSCLLFRAVYVLNYRSRQKNRPKYSRELCSFRGEESAATMTQFFRPKFGNTIRLQDWLSVLVVFCGNPQNRHRSTHRGQKILPNHRLSHHNGPFMIRLVVMCRPTIRRSPLSLEFPTFPFLPIPTPPLIPPSAST